LVKYAAFGRDEILIVGITMCLQIYHNGPRSGLPYLNLTTTPLIKRVSLSTTLEHLEQLYGFEPWELELTTLMITQVVSCKSIFIIVEDDIIDEEELCDFYIELIKLDPEEAKTSVVFCVYSGFLHQ
jgi:hypothetical protein